MSSERRSSSHSTHSPSRLAALHETPAAGLLEQHQKRHRQQPQRALLLEEYLIWVVQKVNTRMVITGSPSDGPDTPMKPKRRRRVTGSEDKPAKNQIFYFVNSNSSSREKRAHVMRHHVQEKRRQRRVSNATSDSDRTPNQGIHYVPWPDRAPGHDEREFNGSHESEYNGIPSSSSSVFRAGYPPLKPSSHSFAHVQHSSPATVLDVPGNKIVDSVPVVLGREDIELADCWTNKLTYWSGQNKHIKDHVFHTAMGHPLTFQAVVLAYCARWKAQIYNTPDSIEVQRHVGQAARGVGEALKGGVPIHEDHLAMAMTGMALHEERFGQKALAHRYVDQAVQILRPRAESSNAVEVFLHYVRYIMSPPDGGPGIDFDGKQWLITFLRGAEELMLEHNTPGYISVVPQRRAAFQMDSPLFPLLSSGPRPSQVPLEARMYVVKDASTQEIARTAALIYITAALWDFQDSPSKTSRFLEHFTTMVRKHSLDRFPACETLIWLLLEERWDPDLRDAERGWSTGELLKTHKSLRPDLQFQFNEILMSFLTMVAPIRGINAFADELDG